MSSLNLADPLGLLYGAAGGAVGLIRGGPSPGRVRRVAVPAAARRLSTLSRIDYADAFVVETGRAADLTGEQWARAMLEGVPVETRRALRLGWGALGLQLGPTSDHRLVLGWELRRSSPDFALLGADSPLGLLGEVLFQRRRRTVLFATFVKHENPFVRAVWRAVAPGHRRAARSVLEQGIELAERPRRASAAGMHRHRVDGAAPRHA